MRTGRGSYETGNLLNNPTKHFEKIEEKLITEGEKKKRGSTTMIVAGEGKKPERKKRQHSVLTLKGKTAM